MAKIQAGLDLLIAGFRGMRTATTKAKTTFPVTPTWWPELWWSQLEGQCRRYLAARGGPFNSNILPSDFPAILSGPDLKTLHAKAVQDVLGSTQTRQEEAA